MGDPPAKFLRVGDAVLLQLHSDPFPGIGVLSARTTGATLAVRTVGEMSTMSSNVVDVESGRGRIVLSFLRLSTNLWKKGLLEFSLMVVSGPEKIEL